MRKYETIFILNSELSEEDSKAIIERVRELVESLQGEVLKIEEWGKKKLAYEVKKMSKGLYVLLHFMGTAQVLSELERNLRLMDAILKYQTVRLDEKAEKMARMLSEQKAPETDAKPEAETPPPTETRPDQDAAAEKPVEEQPRGTTAEVDEGKHKAEEGSGP